MCSVLVLCSDIRQVVILCTAILQFSGKLYAFLMYIGGYICVIICIMFDFQSLLFFVVWL